MADRLILMDSARGADCAALRTALVRALGPAATGYADLATGDDFSAAVKAALARWQAEAGLVADGICGPCCQHELGLRALPDLEQPLEVRTVRRLFPATRPSGIVRHLPYLAAALAAFNLVDRPLILLALAVIRAECEGFVPIGEAPSHGNTLPGLAPFSAYGAASATGTLAMAAATVAAALSRTAADTGAPAPCSASTWRRLRTWPEVAVCLLAARISDRAGRLPGPPLPAATCAAPGA